MSRTIHTLLDGSQCAAACFKIGRGRGKRKAREAMRRHKALLKGSNGMASAMKRMQARLRGEA